MVVKREAYRTDGHGTQVSECGHPGRESTARARLNKLVTENGFAKGTATPTIAFCSPTRAALLTGLNHHRVHSGAMAERAVDWDGYTGVIGKETAAIGQVLPALAADVGSRLFDPSKLCQYLVWLGILATEPTKLHTSGVTPRKVHRAKLPPLSSSSVGFLTHSCPAARAASSQHACTSGRTLSGLATQLTRAAGSLVFRHPRVCRGGGQRG